MLADLDRDGYVVASLPPADVKTLSEISNCLVERANVFYQSVGESRQVTSMGDLRGLSGSMHFRSDGETISLVENILHSGHKAIAQIDEALIPSLSKMAETLGVYVDQNRTLARFRIVSRESGACDHRWHQDSIDPINTSRNDRKSNLAFWIPLHDVNASAGGVEVAVGSHASSLPHAARDASGRLCIARESELHTRSTKVGANFGEVLALDSWIAHRTIPNTTPRARIALIVWF